MFRIKRVDKIKFQNEGETALRWETFQLLKKARVIDTVGKASGAYAQIYGADRFKYLFWDDEVMRIQMPWYRMPVVEIVRV